MKRMVEFFSQQHLHRYSSLCHFQPLRQQCQCALPLATRSWILGIGTSSGVCHPSMTFLPSLSFLPPHPTGCGRRESITPLRKQCQMRCRGQQSCGFSRLPQPIKRHEALKNDVESGGVKNAATSVALSSRAPLLSLSYLGGTSSGVCHPSMTFLFSLSFLLPHPTGCGRRESITSLRQQCPMRCRGQQGHGFSSLPQPIKRHEALKNDVESRGV